MDSGGSCGLQIRYRVDDPAEVGSTPTRSRQKLSEFKKTGHEVSKKTICLVFFLNIGE